jgi:hypothetical protein
MEAVDGAGLLRALRDPLLWQPRAFKRLLHRDQQAHRTAFTTVALVAFTHFIGRMDNSHLGA